MALQPLEASGEAECSQCGCAEGGFGTCIEYANGACGLELTERLDAFGLD